MSLTSLSETQSDSFLPVILSVDLHHFILLARCQFCFHYIVAYFNLSEEKIVCAGVYLCVCVRGQ